MTDRERNGADADRAWRRIKAFGWGEAGTSAVTMVEVTYRKTPYTDGSPSFTVLGRDEADARRKALRKIRRLVTKKE